MSAHAERTRKSPKVATAEAAFSDQSKASPGYQIADHRPETRAQLKLKAVVQNNPKVQKLNTVQAMANQSPQVKQAAQLQALANSHSGSHPVYQRMAIMAVDDIKQQKDTLVWNNLDFGVDKAGGPVGDLKTNKVWDQTKEGEEIRIVEHGEVGELGEHVTGRTIALSMNSGKNKLPPGVRIGKIVFQSCYSGVGGAASLANNMKGFLGFMGQRGVPVEGRKGIAFGFKGMDEKVAKMSAGTYNWQNPEAETFWWDNDMYLDPHGEEKGLKAYLDAMYTLRDYKTSRRNINIFKAPMDYNDPWVIIDKTEDQWKHTGERKRRRLISFQMSKYWEELLKTMTRYKGFKKKDEYQTV